MLILEQKFAISVTVLVGIAMSLALISLCRRKCPDFVGLLVPLTLFVGQLGILLSKWPALSWGPSFTGERRVAFANDFGWLLLLVMTIVLMAGTWRFRRPLTRHAAVIGTGMMLFVLSQVVSSLQADLVLDVEIVAPMILVVGGFSMFPMTFEKAARSVVWILCAVCAMSLFLLLIGTEWVELGSTRRIPMPFIDGRFKGLLTHPNFLAPFAAIGCVVTAVNVTKLRSVAFFVCGLTLWLTDTRTQVFATVVVLLVLCVLAVLQRAPAISQRKSWVIGSSALAVLVIVAVTALWRGSNSSDFGTLNGRTRLWPQAIRYWEASPLIGVGPKAFDLEFRVTNNLEWAYGAHNQFLQTLASEGLLGVLALACVLVGCGLAVRAATGRHKLTLGLLCLLVFSVFFSETPLRLVWFVPAQLFATVTLVLFSAYPSGQRISSEEKAEIINSMDRSLVLESEAS